MFKRDLPGFYEAFVNKLQEISKYFLWSKEYFNRVSIREKDIWIDDRVSDSACENNIKHAP